jgi:maltooligosyltrehalose synthase
MKKFKGYRLSTALVMSFLISPIPQAMAATQITEHPKMISAAEVLRRQTAQTERNELAELMMRNDVRQALEKNGVTHEEASQRLAALSDQEVQRLSHQIKEARAGGDVLTTIVLVLLIIFLIQRI